MGDSLFRQLYNDTLDQKHPKVALLAIIAVIDRLLLGGNWHQQKAGAPRRSESVEGNSSPDFGLHTSFSWASRFRFRFEGKPAP